MVQIEDETFKEMLWDRVKEFCPDSFTDIFWNEAFDYLEECGWLEPEYNKPNYIVDNIYVNGEIRTEEELREDGLVLEDATSSDIERIASDKGWTKCDGYYVLNWGL